jgi:hypothetical protein
MLRNLLDKNYEKFAKIRRNRFGCRRSAGVRNTSSSFGSGWRSYGFAHCAFCRRTLGRKEFPQKKINDSSNGRLFCPSAADRF